MAATMGRTKRTICFIPCDLEAGGKRSPGRTLRMQGKAESSEQRSLQISLTRRTCDSDRSFIRDDRREPGLLVRLFV